MKEVAVKKDYKKVYSLRDIQNWVLYGLKQGYIKKDEESIYKWIELLNNKNITI